MATAEKAFATAPIPPPRSEIVMPYVGIAISFSPGLKNQRW